MKAKRADSELICGLYCAAENSCTSINYKTSGSGIGRCELNNKAGEETSYADYKKICRIQLLYLAVIERVSTMQFKIHFMRLLTLNSIGLC